MRVRRKAVALALFVVSLTSAHGLEPIATVGPPIQPDYLIPINPTERKYESEIEKLLGNRSGNGTMIYTEATSSGRDFVVSAWGRDYVNDRHQKNFITLVEVSLESGGGLLKKYDSDVPIDSEFAIAIQRAWATMLLKTRFPEHRHRGADGWQTEFSVFVRGLGAAYGQLWSPSEGLPKELMDIGFCLADFCKLPEEKRKESREAILQRLNAFTRNVSSKRRRR